MFRLACCLFVLGLAYTQVSCTDTCTYTFQVPQPAGVQCTDAASRTDLQSLQNLLTSQYQALERRLNNVTAQTSGQSGGLVYTIWGRSSCPTSAARVYQGYMGKTHYTLGGGVDYQCLHTEPQFPSGVVAGVQTSGVMYGVEYERYNSPFIPSTLQDQDAPCAVCEVSNRNKVLMIPARLDCPTGWVREYQGMLMSEHSTHKGSTFVCVANNMEPVLGGVVNNDGGLLYVVEAVCGALKCPPYVSGYELACVVCTK